jgi:hypothetical protein
VPAQPVRYHLSRHALGVFSLNPSRSVQFRQNPRTLTIVIQFQENFDQIQVRFRSDSGLTQGKLYWYTFFFKGKKRPGTLVCTTGANGIPFAPAALPCMTTIAAHYLA